MKNFLEEKYSIILIHQPAINGDVNSISFIFLKILDGRLSKFAHYRQFLALWAMILNFYPISILCFIRPVAKQQHPAGRSLRPQTKSERRFLETIQ